MAREWIIAWAGRHRRDEWEVLCSAYRQRIGRHVPITDLPVRASKGGPDGVRIESEGAALLAALPVPCWTIALDRRGRSLSSKALARHLDTVRHEWPHPVAFVIGSDLGLSGQVLEAARDRLSLGPLTLPHELARVVLYEQLYRALSILAGIQYHREPL